MTSTILHLALAMGLFIISHLCMSVRPLRSAIILRSGKYTFLIIYSVVSGVLLGWAIHTFMTAPHVLVFQPSTTLKHISLTLMVFSTFFIVAGYTTPNPGVLGMARLGLQSGAKGVLKITRHPVMWGVILWAMAHILSNGDQAAIIFFGGILILALSGAIHIDQKRRAEYGDCWVRYETETSFLPMLAIVVGRARIERGEIPWWQSALSILIYILALWAHSEMGREVVPLRIF